MNFSNRNLLIFLIGIYCLSWLSPIPAKSQAADREEILQQTVEKYNVPGAVFAKARADSPTRIYTAGLSNIEEKRPLTGDEYFRIGSVTKTFSATTRALTQKTGGILLSW
ncbi:MAG: serine hydrolase [bacterium]